ncbi:P-loop containing nucleoside triphosphate hydrolase protein [Pilobolus umbonatus]|nr:P-loop containing nucleoside triphosphate hydrolase protein [Pilobolus umbonatus]
MTVETHMDEATFLASALCMMSMTEDMPEQEQRSLKTRLVESTTEDTTWIQTMLVNRIEQGRGETLFELGWEEDGTCMHLSQEEYDQAVQTLSRISEQLNADCALIDESNTVETGKVAYMMIRQCAAPVEDLLEIRIAVVGNVDAGKSTMLGVLTTGDLDDGRGKARLNLFRHQHEIESGRTSSVGGEILGFDSKSKPVQHANASVRKMSWDEVCMKSAKVLSFIDLAGHEKYLKTTVFGLTGSAPEFAMLMVGANAGMIGMAKEHLGLALSLGIPVFVVITKIDRCPDHVLKNTIKELTTLLKSKSCRKMPFFVSNTHDVIMTAKNFVSERLCPVFQVSNVTGQGLNLIHQFLNILPSMTHYEQDHPFHFEIIETYSVPFVGTVVCGIMKSGCVRAGDKVVLGPDHAGHFTTTTVKSIQRKRVTVPIAKAGQAVTLALKNIRRHAIRKGMVIVHLDNQPKAHYRFEAEVSILNHSTTIQVGYQAMIHCGAICQTATMTAIENRVLRSRNRDRVTFEFMKTPEYLTLGQLLIFREGHTKGVGKITRLLD